MGVIFQSFIYSMLGNVGRFLLSFYYDYEVILLVIITLYMLILFYARCVLLLYYPNQMKKLIQDQQFHNHEIDVDVLRQLWLEKKVRFPFYVLVPSRNELWVKQARKSSIQHGISFFREKKTFKTDYEQLDDIWNNLVKKNNS